MTTLWQDTARTERINKYIQDVMNGTVQRLIKDGNRAHDLENRYNISVSTIIRYVYKHKLTTPAEFTATRRQKDEHEITDLKRKVLYGKW